jgi:hypothetical protein
MGSSYTRCNSTRITPFLNRRFIKDLMVTNSQLPMTLLKIYFLIPSAYLINNISLFPLIILSHHLFHEIISSFISPFHTLPKLFIFLLLLLSHCIFEDHLQKGELLLLPILHLLIKLEETSSLVDGKTTPNRQQHVRLGTPSWK